MIETRNFVGGLDLDSSLYDVAKGFYMDALNITKNDVSANNDYAATNIVGNREIVYSYPTGRGKVIGAFSFQLRNTVIFFRWNINGYNGIYEGNLTTRTITKIFENLTDSDNVDVLGFTENNKITSVNIYPRDEGDLLFFLDSLGRPTQMDIALFKAGEYTPVTRDILDKGKMPPLSPPQVVYDNDTTRRSNNLRNRLFRFKYRWIYDDFEKSTFSPISIVPLPVSILSDVYTSVITNNNVIRMSVNSGGRNVKSIEAAMSYSIENGWSDFESIEEIKKTALGLTQTTTLTDIDANTIAAIKFSGQAIPTGTTVNIYLTTLPDAETLVGTYTTVAGDTVSDIVIGLALSMVSIGIIPSPTAAGDYLLFNFDNTVYNFRRIDISYVNPDFDNVDFPFAFYNDSTYPDIDINESIQLFDYVPDKANAQEMPNGNVLAYAGITEGYNKDTVEDAIITVLSVPAGNGGVIGSLSVVVAKFNFVFEDKATFSGIPATGTVVNLKLKRQSDHTVIIGGTYTTIAGDTPTSIAAALNFTVPDAVVSGRSGATIYTIIDPGTYEPFPGSPILFLQVEIIPPTTATASNSIATWKWSTERNIARAYFDQKGKTNGILYTDKVTFPAYDEDAGHVPLLPYINYKINDVPPDWAYSVQFYVTKENTQYIFWETLSINKTEAAYIYFEVTSFNTNAIKKPTTAKVLSYTFQDGDRMRIVRDTVVPNVMSDTYDAAIEGLVVDPVISGASVTGTFIKIKNVEPFTSGVQVTTPYVIEIYRPAQQTSNKENQVYFEYGRQYPILDPTLPTRRHSGEVTDQIVGVTPAEYNFYEGDAYFRSRTIASTDTGYQTFNVMDRNFVDFYISAVSSVDGRPNIIDINARRQYFSTLIRFGQAYQANTNINGLNRFYPNNFDEYDYNFGDITRLKVRDRYIKVFQKFKIGVVPLYSQLTKDPNGNSVQVVTDKLLNPIQYRIGNFGLSAPESLASWHFADYGCDVNKGIIWRDSDDGIQPISELYKVDSWATVELPLRTGNFKIYGAIEPKTNKYVIALEAYTVPIPFFNIMATGLNSIINTALTIVSTGDFSIDWGDGTTDNYLAGTVNPTHTYSSPYTGEIKLYTNSFASITSISMPSGTDISPSTGALTILTTELKKLTNLTELIFGDILGEEKPCYLDGIVTDLPQGLLHLVCTDTNLSGTTAQLPRSLITMAIEGDNTIGGNVVYLPPNLTLFLVYGRNTIYGNISLIPRTVLFIFVDGSNTLSGNIADVPPNLIQLSVHGNNSLSGDIAYLPETITVVIVFGNNTLSGDIAVINYLVTFFSIYSDNNTLSGDIASIPPTVTFFQAVGSNTLSGDIALIPAGISFFNVTSAFSTVDIYSAGRTWNSTMNSVISVPGVSGLDATEVDDLLIDLSNVTTWTDDKLIKLLGVNAPRTAASDAAVATLNGIGVTVLTN